MRETEQSRKWLKTSPDLLPDPLEVEIKEGEKSPSGKLTLKAKNSELFVASFLGGKESACQGRRHKRCGFDPWVRKIPWSRKWQPTIITTIRTRMALLPPENAPYVTPKEY